MFQQTLLDYKEDSLSTPSGINASAIACSGTVGAFGSPTFKIIVVIDPDDPTKKEQVRMTATGASFTQMERGFNGTTAQAHAVNAPIRMVMPAFEYNKITTFMEDGWTAVPDYLAIAYASPTTFTLQGDWTSIVTPGDKIRLVNGSTKYFFVTSVTVAAGTSTLSINDGLGGSTTTLAAGAISSPFYSKIQGAAGFPTAASFTLLGYAQVTANMNIASTTYVDIPGLSVAVAIPAGGRKVKISFYCGLVSISAATSVAVTSLVSDSTQLQQGNLGSYGAQNGGPISIQVVTTLTPGVHTIKVQSLIALGGAANANYNAQAIQPMYLLVELI